MIYVKMFRTNLIALFRDDPTTVYLKPSHANSISKNPEKTFLKRAPALFLEGTALMTFPESSSKM